jgi:hypothetical protein
LLFNSEIIFKSGVISVNIAENSSMEVHLGANRRKNQNITFKILDLKGILEYNNFE